MPKILPATPQSSLYCGLHDLDQGGRFQDPIKLEAPYITKYQADEPLRFPRVFKTIWEGVENENGQWLAARKLIGFQSLGPKKFIDAVHELTLDVFGNQSKTYNYALGALLKWTVAQYALSHGEIWLCMKTADTSQKVDPETGKLYEYTAYWLDDGRFNPKAAPGGPGPLIGSGGIIPPRGKGSLDLSGLTGAWGAKVV